MNDLRFIDFIELDEQCHVPVNSAQALEIACRYGQIDGDHHRAWVIDQMVRMLTGYHYESFVKWANEGEDGPDTYEWDIGIAP